MGVIRNAANQQIKGRVGAVTYYVSEGRQIARQALNNSNYGKTASRSEAQQTQRVKWANLVNFYKVCKGWMPKAFENKKAGQSDYNRLMQVNMPYTNIYLPKDEAEVGACVVGDMLISQGSLPTVEISKYGTGYVTNIYVGDLSITEDTTVGEFSEALVNNNTNIEYGMQIAYVSLMQNVDSLGIPRLICTFYEVTLKQNSEDLLWDYLPPLCATITNQCLSTAQDVPIGACAYVISDLRNGSLKVSTQVLQTNNNTLIEGYSSAMALQQAIMSYGLDPGVVLSPLTENEQGATPVPFYIQYIQIGDDVYSPGDAVPAYSEWDDVPYVVVSFSLFGVTPNITGVAVVIDGTIKQATWSPVAQSTGAIKITNDFGVSQAGLLTSITISMSSGQQVEADFNV